MDKYVKIKPLGKGSFGSAILVKRRSDNQLLVVKEVNLSKMSSKEREEARNECKVLQQLNHPNIVRYIEHYEHHGVLYIIMEYADGGDLAQKIKEAGGRGLSEDTSMYYFAQVALALEYLHSRHILHRDIKTMNIFLMKNGAVKLGDFGISTVLRNTMGMANTVCGTPYYFSPELCRNKPYNNRSDIWAMGVVLYELMTGGKHPFDANSMQQLMQRIVKNTYPAPPTHYSKEVRQLLDACLQKDPMRRPNIKQLLGNACVRRSLEKLETDLMLATQCRVRLQDIIDFPARGSGRSTDSASPRASPVPPALQQPRITDGQQVGLVIRDDPRGVIMGNRNAGNSPQPPARPQPPPQQPNNYMHFQVQGAAASPPVINNQLKADLDRVDAFIKQLAQPVNERAKDAIQEYMRRKQEEAAERKRREAEIAKKQEERNAELKRIMDEHQKQMLEHARLKQQRVAQQLGQPSHLCPPAAGIDLSPEVKKRPSVLQQLYGNPTPRRTGLAKQVLAANSPGNAKRILLGGGNNNYRNAAAGDSPQVPSLAPPSGRAQVQVPKHQVVERAQNWADKQADRRKVEIEQKQNKKLEDERRLVRELDGHNGPQLVNRVLDPELDAWVRRAASNAADAIGQARSVSPKPMPPSFHRDEVPAGVDARRRANSNSPAGELQRHVSAAEAVLRDQRGGHGGYAFFPAGMHPHASSDDVVTRPRTPKKERTNHNEFRRGGSQPNEAPSRSSSSGSEQAHLNPTAIRPSQVTDLDLTPDFQARTAPHTGGAASAVGRGPPEAAPIVRLPQDANEEEDTAVPLPDIIQSLRAPAVLEVVAPAKSPEAQDVPVAAYEAMLDHLKHVLEKKPISESASRHKVALLDANVLVGNSTETLGGEQSVLDTEDFIEIGGEEDDEEDESVDDFADEEPITPSHLNPEEESNLTSGTDDDDDDDMGGCDDDENVRTSVDAVGSYRFRHLCGYGFTGECVVNPETGLSLFPTNSASRQTNEFQLRNALERRLSSMGLESVMQQLESLPAAGTPPEAAALHELRHAIATWFAKTKRCPTTAISQHEVAVTMSLCAQLLFFSDE